jgi:hypothetical protein
MKRLRTGQLVPRRAGFSLREFRRSRRVEHIYTYIYVIRLREEGRHRSPMHELSMPKYPLSWSEDMDRSGLLVLVHKQIQLCMTQPFQPCNCNLPKPNTFTRTK